MKKTVQVSLSPRGFSTKPVGLEWGSFRFEVKHLNLDEIAKKIGEGYIYSPIIWRNGERRAINATCATGLAFDFDKATSLKFAEKFENKMVNIYGLKANLLHTTFNHSEFEPRFRLIYFFDHPISPDWYKDFMNLCLEKIPGPDKNCKALAQQFAGTNSTLPKQLIKVKNYELNSAALLQIQAETIHKIQIGKGVLNGAYHKKWLRESGKFASNRFNQPENIYKNYKKIRNFNYSRFADSCHLWRQILNKERHLKFKELFDLASNLAYLEGGIQALEKNMVFLPKNIYKIKKKRNLLKKHEYNVEDDQNLLAILKTQNYNKRRRYAPSNLRQYDILFETFDNILLYHESPYTIYRRPFSDNKYITIEIAREILYNQVIQAFSEPGNYIIRSSPGIGKTTALVNFLKYSQSLNEFNIVCLFPTHFFKNEFVKNLNFYPDLSSKTIVSPDRPELKVDFIKDKAAELLSDESISSVKHYAKIIERLDNRDEKFFQSSKKQYKFFGPGFSEVYSDRFQMVNYIEKHHEFKRQASKSKSKSIIITTHQSAPLISHLLNAEKTILVYDESPFNSLISFSEFQLKTGNIENFIKKSEDKASAKHFVNYYTETPQGHITSNEPPIFNIPKNISTSFKNKLVKLQTCQFFEKENDCYRTIKMVQMPKAFKTIILSATIENVFIEGYNEKFKTKFIIQEIPPVRPKNRTIAYVTKRFSKTQIKKNQLPPEKFIDKRNIITYKDCKHLFNSGLLHSDIHFFAGLGTNELSGKDVLVIGTPIILPSAIRLYAKLLNLNYNPSETYKIQKKVFLSSDHFCSMFTYKDDTLARLECELALSQIAQAEGRARNLCSSGTVIVFGNISTAEMVIVDGIPLHKLKLPQWNEFGEIIETSLT